MLGPASVMAALLLTPVTATAGEAEVASDLPLAAEISRLETQRHAGGLSGTGLQQLAEIYFLTSRCPEALTALQGLDSSRADALACACGKCHHAGEIEFFERFKSLAAEEARWSDPRVRAVWKLERSAPEAKYWALKIIRREPGAYQDTALRALRLELEGALGSLEVNPASRK
jgi:hypothetical protein